LHNKQLHSSHGDEIEGMRWAEHEALMGQIEESIQNFGENKGRRMLGRLIHRWEE
jgi:hypothetical protein